MAKKQEGKKTSNGNIKLQPLGDRVVVEREESESITAGGIVLPDSAKDKPARGKIIAIGDGRLLKGRLSISSTKSRLAIGSCLALTRATPSNSVIVNYYSCEEDILAIIG